MKDEGKVRIREHEIEVKLQMVYWKSDKFWIGVAFRRVLCQ